MHKPRLYRLFRRTHHKSHNPAPFTSYYFDTREAVGQVVFLLLFLTIIAMHMIACSLPGNCSGYGTRPGNIIGIRHNSAVSGPVESWLPDLTGDVTGRPGGRLSHPESGRVCRGSAKALLVATCKPEVAPGVLSKPDPEAAGKRARGTQRGGLRHIPSKARQFIPKRDNYDH